MQSTENVTWNVEEFVRILKRRERDKLKEILNAAEAAKIIGVPTKVVHFNLIKGIWKFGEVIPPKITGKKLNTYQIYARKMCKFFDIPFEEEKGGTSHEILQPH